MTETRDTINHRYGPGQVQYSVIIYGNKGATSFTFDTDSALDMNGLIAAANQSLDVPGPIDLPKALTEAEQLFQSHPTRRPSAKRVFIAITDTAVTDNDTELISAGDALRRQGILVFSVNNTGDGLNAVTITEIDFLGFPPVTTVRSVIIAETIIKKALEGNKEFLGIHDCYYYFLNTDEQQETTHTRKHILTLRPLALMVIPGSYYSNFAFNNTIQFWEYFCLKQEWMRVQIEILVVVVVVGCIKHLKL